LLAKNFLRIGNNRRIDEIAAKDSWKEAVKSC